MRIHERPRVDDLRAQHRGQVRVAPGVCVEHRYDRKERVRLAQRPVERRAGRDAERVQHCRAVRVHDALRPAGGAARVAHGRRIVLVQLRVAPIVGGRARQEVLVARLDHEDVLDRRLTDELLEQRHEHLVDDDDAVAGVRGDVREVGRVQADVQRVEHVAAARDAEVALHVLRVVPAKGRYAVAALESEPVERDGELLRAAHHLAVVRAVEAAVGPPGDDLLPGEVRLGAPHQRRQRQLVVHHLAAHAGNCTALLAAEQRASDHAVAEAIRKALERCADMGVPSDEVARARVLLRQRVLDRTGNRVCRRGLLRARLGQ